MMTTMPLISAINTLSDDEVRPHYTMENHPWWYIPFDKGVGPIENVTWLLAAIALAFVLTVIAHTWFDGFNPITNTYFFIEGLGLIAFSILAWQSNPILTILVPLLFIVLLFVLWLRRKIKNDRKLAKEQHYS